MATGGDHGPQTRSRGPRKDDSIWSENEGQEPAPPTLQFTTTILSRTTVRSTDKVQAEVLDLSLGFGRKVCGIGEAIRDEIRAGM
ncbi:GH22412 [Drosophila grimshawi]|uniref:GH22412 n=1 Tax=Drosophila grimshawi TaxID=7222 RepID=B4JZ36_DROGR|nr:GH22412 [Drosophila grimshawi]